MLHNSIPVVMYHHVSEADRELNIFPDLFEDQLRSLSARGWKTLSGDEFLAFLRDGKERPKKCVLLTFDDGFADNYVFAYPLLKKYGMKAMLFVAADFIEDADVKRDSFVSLTHNAAWDLAFTQRRAEVMCTWKELREMNEDGSFDIQSHGLSHRTPAFMKQENYEALRGDLVGGKAELEKRLSKKIYHLAWPKGHFDRESIAIAGEAGYQALYTTERGANTAKNLTAVRRLPVKCRGGDWLMGKLPIYSSVLLTSVYLRLRTGR
ncbi:MAG: polysaccharide deacetylase family protein [Nitrospiraceae bacterium]|nr:MAG: polysaccharide deacetylase family protein [Nitrospiraceae bacterium]